MVSPDLSRAFLAVLSAGATVPSAANVFRHSATAESNVSKVLFIGCFELFSEDLFYIADFPLHLALHLFRGAAVAQIWIADRFACFLFCLTHGFFCRALD